MDGDIYTNTVESAFSLLKRGITGTWHRVSAKHLQAYLNEMCFRFDNRKNPYLFRDTLLRLLESEHLEYKELTAAQIAANQSRRCDHDHSCARNQSFLESTHKIR